MTSFPDYPCHTVVQDCKYHHLLWFLKTTQILIQSVFKFSFYNLYLRTCLGEGRERTININWLPSECVPSRDWTRYPGIYPDRESYWQAFVIQDYRYSTNWASVANNFIFQLKFTFSVILYYFRVHSNHILYTSR